MVVVRQKVVVKQGGRIELDSDLPEGSSAEVVVMLERSPPSLEELRQRRDDLLRVAAKWGATNLRVFGTVARGEATRESDIDFLVDLQPGRSLWDIGGLMYDLEQLLDRRADVGTASGLRDEIRERVLAEAVTL
jgi:predicted nucleotidyltransferase